jgi:hypothetical protein
VSTTCKEVRTGSTNDEDVLLGVHTIHLGLGVSTAAKCRGKTYKDLVKNSVTCATSITTTSTSGLGDRIQLVKEHDTWSSSSSLVKDISDIGLGFTKPHGKELGTFDRDEIGLTFVGDTDC